MPVIGRLIRFLPPRQPPAPRAAPAAVQLRPFAPPPHRVGKKAANRVVAPWFGGEPCLPAADRIPAPSVGGINCSTWNENC